MVVEFCAVLTDFKYLIYYNHLISYQKVNDLII